MDVRTGEIKNFTEYQWNEFRNTPEAKHFIPINPTTRQLRRKRVGPNEPCPCGSGMKFKKCCKTYEE